MGPSPFDQTWSWPATDIEGWLGVYGRWVVAESPRTVELTDGPAITFDLFVTPPLRPAHSTATNGPARAPIQHTTT